MRLVPISHPRPGQCVICATCTTRVPSSAAFADLDAPAFTFRCLLDALEDGSRVVLSLPVQVVDIDRLRRESRRLYAAQGGDASDAAIEWTLSDAVSECCLSAESFKDHLGVRIGRPSVTLATLALEDRMAPLAWPWAGHPGLILQFEIRVDCIETFRNAVARLGPRPAGDDPSAHLGATLRSFVASLASPIDMGFEIHGHNLHTPEHPNG